MESISTKLPKKIVMSPSRDTERGEFLEYFAQKLNAGRRPKDKEWKLPRVAGKLEGIPTKDLYYLRKKCDEAERNGLPWGAIFHSQLKVRPEVEETN